MRKGLLSKPLFGAALAAGRLAKSFLPRELGDRIPDAPAAGAWPSQRHARRMVIAQGCVQPALAPNIDASMARVLDRIGISAAKSDAGGCCGALPYHLSEHGDARALIRRNIDAWHGEIERGAEAIVVTASGCGVMVKDYGYVMQDDPAYAAKAVKVASLARDPIEVVRAEIDRVAAARSTRGAGTADCVPSAVHAAARHEDRGPGRGPAAGHGLRAAPVPDAHLCCGSAGTYSILQPVIAGQLRDNKLKALEAGRPAEIATANIGCMTHLAAGTRTPVRHWIELLDARMMGAPGG